MHHGHLYGHQNLAQKNPTPFSMLAVPVFYRARKLLNSKLYKLKQPVILIGIKTIRPTFEQ